MQLICRRLGRSAYGDTLQAMQRFTDARRDDTVDELWLTEHAPVFTLGRNAKTAHILDAGSIPQWRSDRGGQVTYHGPGQLVVYTLLDLRRLGIGVRQLVSGIEQSLIDLLADYAIDGCRRDQAPGVYVGGKKIASLGLRIRRHCSYHGLSLNIAMDLAPFSRILPCGQAGLEVTQLSELGVDTGAEALAERLCQHIQRIFGYTELVFTNDEAMHV